MPEAAFIPSACARHALELVSDGFVVGLGTGHAATAFVLALAERVRQGLRVRGVATSETTTNLARQLGIPLTTLDEVDAIDLDVDGADEVDPRLDLIKGYGGALVREKIVAAAARRVVILVGPEKLVPVLGSHGKLPVEVVPFALTSCQRALAALGCPAVPRKNGDKLLVTDNSNLILDCRIAPLVDPHALEASIRQIPGVVGTGLFLGMACTVLIERDGSVEVRERGLA